ncbi:hypothetical protein C5B42_03260 [Candidatus Cerribacteria bacterium 'Amazon FNV 2010 28 9']|uniref:SMP-30/Gluconolactonase/LRE-like region domain-containing protein n=1 Tax=Candidatus Cerribacteria bacterium 'Amazon FNV 2010 28 9' TaxID=2081795 RepID=A0A317JP40_9BACT|nr:MAG: hypothetical protein C5B42_03260 [Candidatus Cerribacteria bacterium 'Amazon FNV 2010 28 9']
MKTNTLSDTGALGAVIVQAPIPAAPTQTIPGVVPPVRPQTNPQRTMHIPTLAPVHWKVFRRAHKKQLFVAVGIGVLLVALVGLRTYMSVHEQSVIRSTLSVYQQRLDALTKGNNRIQEIKGMRDLMSEVEDREKNTQDAALAHAYAGFLLQLQTQYAQVSGERHIEKLNTFYDFRLVAADFMATALDFDIPGKVAVVLDGNKSRILSLSLEKKEAIPLSIDAQLPSPFDVSVSDRNAYVLANGGVMQLSLPLDTIGSVVIARDSTWQTPKLIDTFGTNAYILDTGARALFKYDLTSPTASPSNWFKTEQGINFDTITTLRVDGNVWLGDSNGQVMKFMQGNKVPFTLQGVVDPPSSSITLFTTPDSDALYILEPRAKRILIVGKDGAYKSSIISDDLSTADKLIVDEGDKKIYVLAGSLMYEIDMQ